MIPNIGKPLRITYVTFGVILLICWLLVPLQLWMRIGALVLGILSIIGGATGR